MVNQVSSKITTWAVCILATIFVTHRVHPEKPLSLTQFLQKDHTNQELLGELEKEIHQFVRHVTKQANTSSWFGKPPAKSWFDLDSLSFTNTNVDSLPKDFYTEFVGKKILSSSARVILIGDTHARPITTILQELVAQSILTPDFHLTNKDDIIVFLGDLADGNTQPIYLFNQALKLRAANPDNVFFLKGNHEDFFVNKYFAKNFHESKKTPGVFYYNVVKSYLYPKDEPDYLPKPVETFLAHFQEHFMSAFYVGCCNKTGKTDYVQCCHGGLEPGYDPYPFLASDKSYQQITDLKRSWFFKKYKTEKLWADEKTSDNVFDGLKAQYRAEYDKDILVVDPSHGTFHTDKAYEDMNKAIVGHPWNYFLTENFPLDAPCYSLCGHLITLNLVFSYEQTVDLLTNKTENQNHQVVTIFRGHQHHDFPQIVDAQNPKIKCMLRKDLKKNHGLKSQWGGLVNTLVNCANRVGYEAFAVLQLAPSPGEWAVTHFYKTRNGAKFEKSIYDPMLLKRFFVKSEWFNYTE